MPQIEMIIVCGRAEAIVVSFRVRNVITDRLYEYYV